MTSPTLSPLACAEQFDLYASVFAKDATEWSAKSDAFLGQEGKSVQLAYAVAQHAAAEAAAFQLRFAATFLRENAVLRWTHEDPVAPGWYWVRYRLGNGETVTRVIERRHPATNSSGPCYNWDQANGHVAIDREAPTTMWAGPVTPPEESS